MEADVTAAFAELGWTVERGQRRRPGDRPRLHLEPADGHRGVQGHPGRRAAHRRRGGLAVQPPRARRAAHPPRADPHRRELRRRLAGPRRPARPQRGHDQDGHAVLARSGASTSPTTGSAPASASWIETGSITARRLARARPARAARQRRGRSSAARSRRQLLADKAIIGVFDEGCMGMYNAIIDDELLNPLGIYKERLSQSRALGRDADGRRPGGRRGRRLARGEGHDLPARHRRGDRADRGPGALAVQDVHRRAAHQRRLRTRRGRHPVPAGPQGPRRRHPTSPRACSTTSTARRSPRATAPACSARAARSRTSTRPTRASPSTRSSPTGSGPRWASTRRPRCTTCAGARTTTAQFVWVFEISGSVPPSHLEGGYAGAQGWRQNPVYFPLGGSTIKGVSQARRGRLVARLHRGRRAARRPRSRRPSSSCPPRRPSAAGRRPTRSGRSCTPCCTA